MRIIKQHKLSNTPTYYSWVCMKTRCLNKKSDKYKFYGARGVTVCDRWLSFINFYEDMGERPKGKTLDRIDNTKGYSKNNCKWSNWEEQQNNRLNNRLLKFKGRKKTISRLAREFKLPYQCLYLRVSRDKWSVEKALTTPVRKYIKKLKK